MAETRKLRFKVSRGYGGAIIRAGATVEISEFWAKIFIADGTAEPVEESGPAAPQANSKDKKNGKTGKGKS